MSAADLSSARGLADLPSDWLGPEVVRAWDDFLALAEQLDFDAPTRLPGWRVHDVLVHLGTWDDHRPIDDLLETAGASTTKRELEPDRINAVIVRNHAGASRADVLASLQRGRERAATYFADDSHERVGRQLGSSVLGPLPVGCVVHAACYELAVHALDVAPDAVTPHLLSRGLASLADVTGALAARHHIDVSVACATPDGGWSFTAERGGWATTERAESSPPLAGVEGSAVTILEASAGRQNPVALLVSRKLIVHKLPTLLRLAPIVDAVPGIPGGPALKSTVRHLSGAGRLLGRLPGLRRG